jgi:hypothetical protein
MSFKSLYTCEEAALTAAELNDMFCGVGLYFSMEDARKAYELDCERNRPNGGYTKLMAAYKKAVDIQSSLELGVNTGHMESITSNGRQYIDHKVLAVWFIDLGDVKTAKVFYADVLSIWNRDTGKRRASIPVKAEISTKTKNAYLKTISALSMALISGSTGKPFTDAEAVLSLLDKAGIEHPVSRRTLADYLKEAGDN